MTNLSVHPPFESGLKRTYVQAFEAPEAQRIQEKFYQIIGFCESNILSFLTAADWESFHEFYPAAPPVKLIEAMRIAGATASTFQYFLNRSKSMPVPIPRITRLDLTDEPWIPTEKFIFLITLLPDLHTLNIQNSRRLRSEAIIDGIKIRENLHCLHLPVKATFTTDQLISLCRRLPFLEKLDLSSSRQIGDAGFQAIAALRKIKSLTLSSDSTLTDQTLIAICQNCTELEGLHIPSCPEITANGLRAIANCQNLKQVTFPAGPHLTEDVLALICKSCSQLREIEFSGNRGGPRIRPLALCQNLCKLTFAPNTYLKEEDLKIICTRCPIEELKIPRCLGLTPNGMMAIGECRNLRKLVLISIPTLKGTVLEKICQNCLELSELKLEFCQGLTEADYCFITLCKSLQILSLSGAQNLTDYTLIEILKHCTLLQKLDVSECNELSGYAFEGEKKLPNLTILKGSFFHSDIASFAKRCPNLEELDGVYHNLKNKDLIPLKSLPKIRAISLANNSLLSDKSLELILNSWPSLTSLSLNGNHKYTPAMLEKIANLTGLISLDLGSTQATDVIVRSILKNCPHLDDLDLSYCDHISDPTLQWIRRQFPTLTLLTNER